MKLVILGLLCLCQSATAQFLLNGSAVVPGDSTGIVHKSAVKIEKTGKWKMSRNKWITGGLMFLAGSAKGFNEILQYNWDGFEKVFPDANPKWFYPPISYANKYKDGDPAKGPKFPFSTSLLVMFTDQYHLNNFIQRASITTALVIKIGEGKRPFRHYVFDVLYYTACYQLGFNAVYQPMKVR